jgi:hypothetical protein
MNFEQRIKGIKDWIDQEEYIDENVFDKEILFEQKYLNFQIDDCYDYLDKVVDNTRNEIFRVLHQTYSKWKTELIGLNIPFYLGVWIYNPRLPKSEVVCAIGNKKIDYYQNKCFDISKEKGKTIDIQQFKKEKDIIWTKKIDFDTLEDWEINFPKENYENDQHWMEYQDRFKKFIKESYKVDESKKGKIYYKNVGEIWTGEVVKK